MARAWVVVVGVGLMVAGCVPPRGTEPAGLSTPDMADSAPPPANDAAFIFGHSAEVLYTLDANTLAVSQVGYFGWPDPTAGEQMTDIAVDAAGHMIGVSFDSVYAIDTATAKCTFLAPFLGSNFNALSFIAGAQVQSTDAEVLVGATQRGEVYSIDPSTGEQTLLGAFGGGLISSGDLVSVAGATYATVRTGATGNDLLVTIDGQTGEVLTTIGNTGVPNIWGLGYWRQKLFGFTESNGLVSIDVSTGVATAIPGTDISWFGAGVTTAAPTTIQ